MPFRGHLEMRWLRRICKMKLLKPFTYITPDKEVITVPRNFISDGASIPKFAWSLIGGPFSGKYLEPAIIHDWLCVLSDKGKYSRERADSVFSMAMAENKVFPLKRKIMWLGVRIGALLGRKK